MVFCMKDIGKVVSIVLYTVVHVADHTRIANPKVPEVGVGAWLVENISFNNRNSSIMRILERLRAPLWTLRHAPFQSKYKDRAENHPSHSDVVLC